MRKCVWLMNSLYCFRGGFLKEFLFVLCVCSCAPMWKTTFKWCSSSSRLVWNRISSFCTFTTGESSVPTSHFPSGTCWALKGDFYVGSGDPNSCPQACMANAFTHWAVSSATKEWIFYIFVYLFSWDRVLLWSPGDLEFMEIHLILWLKAYANMACKWILEDFDLTRSGSADL